ncbi:MAG: hypothetical protein KGQ57_00220 [Burkholderiales bacterium]|nr:hypothetical protein [Burkholderiales bacterium]
MQGKNLFLDRVVPRTQEWQCRYAALGAACQDPNSASEGRQVVAAMADADGIRWIFFSSLGSVLDFSANWGEFDRAGAWLDFVARWNYWMFPTEPDRLAFSRLGLVPERFAIVLAPGTDTVDRSDHSVVAYLDHLERRFRSHSASFAGGRLEEYPREALA